MIPVIGVRDSNGEVMAPMCGRPGEFYPGKLRRIKIVGLDPDESVPLEIREALIGLSIRTVFDRDLLSKIGNFADIIPVGALIAYMKDVAEALTATGKKGLAAELLKIGESPLAFYVFPSGIFKTIE